MKRFRNIFDDWWTDPKIVLGILSGRKTPVNPYIIQDAFTVADGTNINGRTPDIAPVGSVWDVVSGTWLVNGGRLVYPGFDSSKVVIETGISELTVSANLYLNDTTTYGGIIFRYQDSTHNWFAQYGRNSGEIAVYEQNGGFTKRASAVIGYLDGGLFSVSTKNNIITVSYNATIVSYTSSLFATATKVGLRNGADGGIGSAGSIDNFNVVVA